MNAGALHVCDIAILTGPDHCPWSAAKVCFQNQRDFNYLEMRLLEEIAIVDGEAIELAAMRYRMLILDGPESLSPAVATKLAPMIRAGRVVSWCGSGTSGTVAGAPCAQRISTPAALIDAMARCCPVDVATSTAVPDLRYRHVVKGENDYYLFFNEGGRPLETEIRIAAEGTRTWIDTVSGASTRTAHPLCLKLAPFGVALLQIAGLHR